MSRPDLTMSSCRPTCVRILDDLQGNVDFGSVAGRNRRRDDFAALVDAIRDGADPHLVSSGGPQGSWARPTVLATAVSHRHAALVEAVVRSPRFDHDREHATTGGLHWIPTHLRHDGPAGRMIAGSLIRSGMPLFGGPDDDALPSGWDIADDPDGRSDADLRLRIVRLHAEAVDSGGLKARRAVASWIGRDGHGHDRDEGHRAVVLRWLPVHPELLEPAVVVAVAAGDDLRFLAAAGRTS